jgi:bidirectional [NiFe] hydrogenase diaphorase subunit
VPGDRLLRQGAGELLAAVENYAGIKASGTTPDGQLSLLIARCIGACGIAPAVVYDRITAGHQTAEQVLQHVKEWVHDGPG